MRLCDKQYNGRVGKDTSTASGYTIKLQRYLRQIKILTCLIKSFVVARLLLCTRLMRAIRNLQQFGKLFLEYSSVEEVENDGQASANLNLLHELHVLEKHYNCVKINDF